MARQSVRSTLLAIDHADRRSALETCLTQRLDGVDRGSARCHHVLDQAYALPRFERAFEAVRSSIALRFLAHDQEGHPRCECRRRGERDRAELRARDPNGVRLVVRDRSRNSLAERSEHFWTRLEEVLVEVVRRM